MDAGTSREGRLLGEASRIDGRSLDWSLERMSALYRHAPRRFIEKGDNPRTFHVCPEEAASYNRRPVPLIQPRRRKPAATDESSQGRLDGFAADARLARVRPGARAAVAASFGASGFTDAYNVAFRIPNLLRRLFAEGAFSQAFVPLLANTRISEGDEVTHRLIDAVATVLAWALLATCVIGVVGGAGAGLGDGLGPGALRRRPC